MESLRVEVEADGQVVGELEQASSVGVTPYPLNSLPTAVATVRTDNPLVPYLALGDRARLKVYSDLEELIFRGPVTSFEKIVSAGQKSVAVGATGIGWKLGYRSIPASRLKTGYSDGTALAPKDRSTLLRNVVDAIQAEASEGIVIGTITPAGATSYVGPWHEKYGLEAVTEISAPLDGPDWLIAPIEDTAGGIGRLDVGPAFGANREDAVWEFGTGRNNVAGWTQRIALDALATRARHLPAGWPDSALDDPVEWSDADAIELRGIYDATVTADLTVAGLRTKLVQAHVALRKQPRQVITFEPTAAALGDLRYRVDYAEGDLIRFHALERYPVRDGNGRTISYSEVDTVDAIFRLRAVTFTRDARGKITPAFTVLEN